MNGRTLLQFAIVTLIWGSTWLIIRTQLGEVPPSWSVAYRFTVAAITMLTYCVLTRQTLRLDRRGHLFAVVLAVAQFGFNFNFVYRAEQHVTSGLVAVVFALLVVPNAILARAFLGQQVSLRFAIGSLIGIAGVTLLFQHEIALAASGTGTSSVMLGLLLTIGGVLSASAANVMQATQTGLAQPRFGLLAISFVYGAIFDAGYALLTAGPPVILLTPTYLGGLLFLGIAASALAFPLYYDVIRAIGPAKAAYSSLIVPFLALALSTLFEGYRWTPIAGAGAVLAVGGMWVALSSRRTTAR